MSDGRLQKLRLIRRVQQHQIKFFPDGLQKLHGVPGHNAGPVRQVAELQIFPNQLHGVRSLVHKYSGGRSAAETLDSKLPRPREQVQHPPPLNIELQDVEQSLLHSIRCRAGLHSLQLF